VSLVVTDVRYRYAGSSVRALDGIGFELRRGRVLGVSGANDAGKSTLCLVTAGLAPATIGGDLQGTVRIDGIVTGEARPHELAQRCGVLFQNPSTQLSGTSSTVWEEVAFGPRNLGLAVGDVVDRVEEALASLAIEGLADRDPERLSGGQAQLVALAGVLALRPAYLILDEPSSQLDPFGTRLVADAIARLVAETDAGVLIVEHKTEVLARVCDAMLILVDGVLAADGDAASVLADPRLADWGVEAPALVRLRRAAEAAGIALPEVTS
jgi:energy-coupling factor transport system ATP-binding protein